jgi:hypothetical protein
LKLSCILNICFQLEERKESSQTSTLEKPNSKNDSTKDCEENENKFDENEVDQNKFDDSTLQKVDQKSKLGENDESAVRYIQV